MIGALNRKALTTAVLVLLLCPGTLICQESLPGLNAPGGNVPDRLSPQEMEQASRKRDLEGILTQLRELHARGQYEEMLRVIQEAERTYPNDFKLRNYGYLAQDGLEASRRGTVEPLVSPNSPALQGIPGGTASTQLPPSAGTLTPESSEATGLPPLPGTTQASSDLPDLPPLPDSTPVLSPEPASTPKQGASAAPAPADGDSTVANEAAEGARGITGRLTGPVGRLVLVGIAVLAAVLGALALLRRRKAAAEAEAAARRTARAATGGGRVGSSMPPPIPASAAYGAGAASTSIRDALTEVEVNEEEVARGIAESIGSRPTTAPAATMPTFESLFPTAGTDQPTGFHENMPTMVDTLVEDEPEPPASAPAGIFSLSEAPPPGVAPVPPSLAKTPASSDGVSFDDLGIVLFDNPPPPAPAPAEGDVRVSAPKNAEPDDPFAGFNFGGLALPEDTAKPASTHAAPQASAPAVSESARPKPADLPLPGLPAGDEPIRLDDFKFLAPGDETVAVPAGGSASANAGPTKPVDDSLSATVDLSEVLFGKSMSEAQPADGNSGRARSASPFDETVAMPALDNNNSASPDAPISLDSLNLSLDIPPPSLGPSSAAPNSGSQPANADTVQIPSLSLPLGSSGAASDDTLAATIGLEEATVGLTVTNREAVTEHFAAAPPASAQTNPEEQSYYASAPRTDASLDERSDRMFREQFARAEKAIEEANWKQAVHYLSIAAAIRPDDADVVQKLKHAREQKRRQEAGV